MIASCLFKPFRKQWLLQPEKRKRQKTISFFSASQKKSCTTHTRRIIAMTQVEDASLEQDLEERVRVLLQDELLKDVPANPRIEEIETLISVEQGRAYQITIDRSPLEPLCKRLVYFEFCVVHT